MPLKATPGKERVANWVAMLPRLLVSACALISALVGPSIPASAQKGEAEQRLLVTRFQGARKAALSYTFDDGLRDHYTIAFPMLNKLGLKGTFYVVGKPILDSSELAAAKKPGSFGSISWPELKEMAEAGHEIGNHSWSHPHLTVLEEAPLREEIDRNAQMITEKVGQAPLTFCYPGNGRNDKVRATVLKNHVAAREIQFEIGMPTLTAADANRWADETLAKREWGVAMLHGIKHGYHALSSEAVLEEHLQFVKARQNEIWVDTFANVARYRLQREAAKFQDVKVAANQIDFVLECPLDPKTYNVPLTVRVATGPLKTATARRGEQILPVEVRDGLVLVTAVPDSLPITVSWQ